MPDPDRVLAFLGEIKPFKYCDDCLTEKLGLSSRQRAYQVCDTLGKNGQIIREKAYCHFCRKLKWTSAHLVAHSVSAASEGADAALASGKSERSCGAGRHSDFSGLTPNERNAVEKVSNRVQRLRSFFAQNVPPTGSATPEEWFSYLARFKDELGNFNNEVSRMATLMAKQYLVAHLDMNPFDALEKEQGAPGLDIDERTTTDERVVAEIKTTHPFKHDDLGAAQADSFRKDAAKLASADARHKFFFVTDIMTFAVLKKPKYKEWFDGVRVVLLPSGDEI